VPRRGSPNLRALREKYERLLALRVVHERAKRDASFVEPDPRPEMSAIARAWPGALRELDELPLDEIRARIASLDEAWADRAHVEPWMVAQDAFHRLARGALAAKRWLGKRRRVTPEVRAAFRASAPSEALLWEEALADVAAPPRGRLMDLVHARVASEIGASVAEARRPVFAGCGR
jgi:hypothetical protein